MSLTNMTTFQFIEGILTQIADRAEKHTDSEFYELSQLYAYDRHDELRDDFPELNIIIVYYDIIKTYYNENDRCQIENTCICIALPTGLRGKVTDINISDFNIIPTSSPYEPIRYDWKIKYIDECYN